MTLRHIVAWQMNGEDAAERSAQAAEFAARLIALRGVVPSIREISAGPGIIEGNWDIAVVADFDDEAGLAAYAVHPAHLEVVAFAKTVVDSRAAVDFIL